MGGWFGRALTVDVESGTTETTAIPTDVLRRFIGGAGLGTWLLSRAIAPHTDPLSPEAAIVFAFGPLAGTPLTTSAKLAVVAKSPLTMRLSDALTSSGFALSGKRCGVDALVVLGRAREPSILLVDDGRARVIPATDLWGAGLGVTDVTARLAERHAGFDFAVIGTAGERLVRYAGLANDGRHAGRGGLGAVLGSKRIKAIGVRGTGRVEIANVPRTLELAKDLARRSIGPATEKYREIGTVANLATLNRLAALPSRNFQAATFEGATDLSGEVLRTTRERGRGSCLSCTIGCEHFFEATPGTPPVKAEYENVFALGPLCGVRDPGHVLAASRACDELGLDTISAGGTIAFAMECAERGLLDAGPWAEQARGLRFGDAPRMLELLSAIAERRGPLGDLLAEGSRRAADAVGQGAADFAPHVKGLEIPGYDPRSLQTMALGFAVGPRGADHNKSGAYEADLSGKVNRLAGSADSAIAAIETEDRAAIMDSLILCKFLRGALSDYWSECAELLVAVTGASYDATSLHEAARRIVLAKRAFNERHGWTQAEDTLPARFFDRPIPEGAARGAVLTRDGLRAMIEAYYRARGLAADGTVPADFLGRELAF